MGKKSVVKFERGVLKNSFRLPIIASNICKVDLTIVQTEPIDGLTASTTFTALSPPKFIANKQLLI
jgi:hypothetical protein